MGLPLQRGQQWKCPKCQNIDVEKGQFAAVGGGFFSRWFNYQNKKFTTLTCKKCFFTEIYKTHSSKLSNFLDIISGG